MHSVRARPRITPRPARGGPVPPVRATLQRGYSCETLPSRPPTHTRHGSGGPFGLARHRLERIWLCSPAPVAHIAPCCASELPRAPETLSRPPAPGLPCQLGAPHSLDRRWHARTIGHSPHGNSARNTHEALECTLLVRFARPPPATPPPSRASITPLAPSPPLRPPRLSRVVGRKPPRPPAQVARTRGAPSVQDTQSFPHPFATRARFGLQSRPAQRNRSHNEPPHATTAIAAAPRIMEAPRVPMDPYTARAAGTPHLWYPPLTTAYRPTAPARYAPSLQELIPTSLHLTDVQAEPRAKCRQTIILTIIDPPAAQLYRSRTATLSPHHGSASEVRTTALGTAQQSLLAQLGTSPSSHHASGTSDYRLPMTARVSQKLHLSAVRFRININNRNDPRLLMKPHDTPHIIPQTPRDRTSAALPRPLLAPKAHGEPLGATPRSPRRRGAIAQLLPNNPFLNSPHCRPERRTTYFPR